MFGGGYEEGVKPEFDREGGKAGFGTNADWKTQGGMAKPVNVGPTKADTYLQKQVICSTLFFPVIAKMSSETHLPFFVIAFFIFLGYSYTLNMVYVSSAKYAFSQ